MRLQQDLLGNLFALGFQRIIQLIDILLVPAAQELLGGRLEGVEIGRMRRLREIDEPVIVQEQYEEDGGRRAHPLFVLDEPLFRIEYLVPGEFRVLDEPSRQRQHRRLAAA